MKYTSLFIQSKVTLLLAFIFLISLLSPIHSQTKASSFSESNTYKKMVGERIFHGLISTNDNVPSCISCHAKFTGDEINWNPSFSEIATIADTLSPGEFKALVNSPAEGFITKVHQGYNLSDENLASLQYYLKTFDKAELETPPKSYPKLIWFLVVGALMALALVDLFFTHFVHYKVIHILVLMVGVSVHLKMAYTEGAGLGRSQGYSPDQPIKFSHQVHAGDNKIDCKYCHFNAEQGKSAGIPGPGLCMNCHMIVREGTRSGKTEIAKLVKHFEQGKDIEWIRIHNLPDHVYFNHSQHVQAGQLDCAECHGKVEEMHILKQENDLSMKWCLDCHKKTNVQFINNDYYAIYKDYHKGLAEGIQDSIKAVDIGANDCMKCHH
jgi:uncharacterized membrane protein